MLLCLSSFLNLELVVIARPSLETCAGPLQTLQITIVAVLVDSPPLRMPATPHHNNGLPNRSRQKRSFRHMALHFVSGQSGQSGYACRMTADWCSQSRRSVSFDAQGFSLGQDFEPLQDGCSWVRVRWMRVAANRMC